MNGSNDQSKYGSKSNADCFQTTFLFFFLTSCEYAHPNLIYMDKKTRNESRIFILKREPGGLTSAEQGSVSHRGDK